MNSGNVTRGTPLRAFAHTYTSGFRLQRLSRYAYAITAGFIIAVGLILRLHHFGRDLSIAESWVANSVLANSLAGMFYYEDWLQTTPPLFLLLVRTTENLFGLSNNSLCAVPLAFSLLALWLLAALARRMLRPPFALICLSLLALSPPVIAFSKQLKQYSADVAMSALLLLVLWQYLHESSRRHYFWLLAAFAVALPLSYTAVVFVPLAICVLVFGGTAERPGLGVRTVAFRCSGLVLLTAIICCCIYFLFVRPNTSPRLQEFWTVGYPPQGGWAATLDFVAKHFLATVVYFSLPLQSALNEALRPLLLSLPGYLKFAAIVVALLLLAVLIRAARRERSILWAILFFFVPLLTLIALNWARLYPVSSRRLTLFLVPCVAVVAAAVLQVVWQRLAGRASPWRPSLLLYPLVAVATALPGLALQRAGWDQDESGDRGAESAVRYLRSEVDRATDMIYVHATLDEPVRLYLTMLGWNDAPSRTGRTGWPCCKRFAETRPADPAQERAYVTSELDNIIGKRPEGRLWIVFWEAARRPWLAWVKINEPATIVDHLQSTGCQVEFERRFESIVVDSFRCNNLAAAIK
jgi:hypothetical protein